MHVRSRHSLFAMAAIVLTMLVGCATAEKRFEQGINLEHGGRSREAAERYIDALRKDATYTPARQRLAESGTRAVSELLARSDQALTRAQAETAADHLRQLDELIRGSADVGVQLALPGDYARRRRHVFDAAIEEAARGAESSAVRGRYRETLQGIERAQERYAPDPEQFRMLARAHGDASLAWSTAELEQGNFRSAYERAEHLARRLDADAAATRRAEDIMADALARGTRTLAVLPVRTAPRQLDSIPATILATLNDAIELDDFARPPLFIRTLSGAPTRSRLRRMRLDAWDPSEVSAYRTGRELGADLVVVTSVDTAWTRDVETRSARRAVKTTAGQDTAYAAVTSQRTIGLRLEYSLYDVRQRRVLKRDSYMSTEAATFEHARFEGDWRTLGLNRAERTLFAGRSEAEANQRIADALTEEVGRWLSRSAYDAAARSID